MDINNYGTQVVKFESTPRKTYAVMHISDMMSWMDSPGENVGDPLVGSRSHFAPGVCSKVGKEINVKKRRRSIETLPVRQ